MKRGRVVVRSPGRLRRIYGIDFSGAADAGKKIWITSGEVAKDTLHITDCYRAKDLPGSGDERGRCMTALRSLIAKERGSAFGIDFPFGLPRDLVKEDRWEDFILSFPQRYSSAEKFRKTSFTTAGKSEWKRFTDRKCRTPFSPYNLRLYRQTYFGICEVLAPLVRDRLACVLPMQKALPGKPWLLEVCPASTLKQAHLYVPYKGRTLSHYSVRARILAWVENACAMPLPGIVQKAILNDYYGDALDSVIAAFATFRTFRYRSVVPAGVNDTYMLEGYVYG